MMSPRGWSFLNSLTALHAQGMQRPQPVNDARIAVAHTSAVVGPRRQRAPAESRTSLSRVADEPAPLLVADLVHDEPEVVVHADSERPLNLGPACRASLTAW